MGIEWVFDPAPPSGKRRGGNSAEYSFEGRIDIFVREVVQNSLDARLSDDVPVDIRFRIVELDDRKCDEFLESIKWDSLLDNLVAVPEPRGGHAIQSALEGIKKDRKLRLLIVEDRGTKGLNGAEQRRSDEEKNSFCALVRDELYSDKDDSDAAGSFGLGKSVLWSYSSLKTVLFGSVPSSPEVGYEGVRFIGRASLPYHETDIDGPVTGDGWLGVVNELGNGQRRADSAWGERASRLAKNCFCPRMREESGLSTVVIGFSEPGDEDRPGLEVAQSIVNAGVESFWPSIVDERLHIHVTVECNENLVKTYELDSTSMVAYQPAIDLLTAYRQRSLEQLEFLNEPGDQAVRWIPISVPERISTESPHSAFDGRVPVLVRLLDDSSDIDQIRDRIFRFRRSGMVVRSSLGANLSIAAKPYVAVVPVGVAASGGAENERIEYFLRAAEPPEHNEWTHNTRSIKENYVTYGCRKKLADFDNSILEAIRNLVAPPEKKGGELPRAILQHLHFGSTGGSGHERFISVTNEKAWPDAGTWKFSGRCRRVHPDDRPWEVIVKLQYAVDGGGSDEVHALSEISSADAVKAEIINGAGILHFPPDVKSASFSGATDPAKLPAVGVRTAVRLRIDGRAGGQAHA